MTITAAQYREAVEETKHMVERHGQALKNIGTASYKAETSTSDFAAIAYELACAMAGYEPEGCGLDHGAMRAISIDELREAIGDAFRTWQATTEGEEDLVERILAIVVGGEQ